MKGLILAGGAGSRLYPMTKVTTKQLQPVYDKPMIYYPLSFLMLGGIKDILIITAPDDLDKFQHLLGDGSHLGINLSYKVQDAPRGLPEAFLIGSDFIGDDDVTLILGDNIFYGDITFFRNTLKNFNSEKDRVTGRIFAYYVSNPEEYGVVEFERGSRKITSLEEKPAKPKSNYAIPGLYVFDSTSIERAKKLNPSPRGELEITDLIKSYLHDNLLGVDIITRGVAWLDTGTPRSLLEASSYVGAIEARQGLKIACLEEISYRMNYISLDELAQLAETLPRSSYKDYLEKLIIIEKEGQ